MKTYAQAVRLVEKALKALEEVPPTRLTYMQDEAISEIREWLK